ncbi:MAG: DegT/DnrJ/EryC1/StrS family aminotransferase [Chloroflexi bacterium]|uniref:DegT/DnrJ/EryC1/StrS family aminotransferase n=1 Tax=Candidatus Flexifilum breve TaxID=3140694 RepID=UPI0031356998|nr:DegT/DnrJ/EryC1/StrS family aminotransferase [Chloroflexota bacterium]
MIPISSPQFGEEELALVKEVLESGIIAQGPKVAALEQEFAKLSGTQFAVAVANGTAALHLALLANGIGPGDEVITSPFTFIASANSVLYTGARPVFVDIKEDTFNIDPALIESAITPRTKAIMPVHLYGLMADMDAIMDIAQRHNLAVIEDAAQAHGATNQGRPAGSFGTGAFSLYATKNMTTAEGGMVTTNDPAIAERVKLLRAHGMKVRYYHDMLGFNFRMTDMHAALGLAQIRKLPMFNERRRQNAEFFNQHLKRVVTPHAPEGYGHVWHQYTIRVTDGDRDAAVKKLTDAGVGTGIFYPVPVYRQKVYTELGYNQSLPVTELVTQQVISLPVHPKLTSADLETIVAAVESL